jgi:hypothetical protein
MGASAPTIASGAFTSKEFNLYFVGPASLTKLSALTSDFGVLHTPLTSISQRGRANLDLAVQAPWIQGVAPAQADQSGHPELAMVARGTMQIQNAEWKTSFLPDPVEIISATVRIDPAQIAWSDVSLTFHHIPARATLNYPATCDGLDSDSIGTHSEADAVATPLRCPAHFTLEMATLNAAGLQSALLGAGDHGELLDSLLARIESHTANLPATEGTIRAANFTLGTLTLHNALASLTAQGSHIRIVSLDGAALSGTMHAAGGIDTTGHSPAYSLKLDLNHISIADAAALFHERWGTGTISGSAQLKAQGFTPSALAESATGNFHWDWQKGTLAGIADTASISLARFDHWTSDGTIQDSKLTLTQGQLIHNDETGAITGTVSFERQINLRLTTATGQQTIAGSIAEPTVEAANPATASLH